MNIKSAVFGLVSIKPQSINSVVNRIPYSKNSIYNAIESMLREGDLIKSKINDEIKLDIPKDYIHQKKQEFYIKSLSYGIDPELLLRKNSLKLWNALDHADTISDLSEEFNLSGKSIRKILHYFSNCGLIYFKKKNPLIAHKKKNHPLNKLLNAIVKPKEIDDTIYSSGSTPYDEIVTTPDKIENILYEKIDNSLTVRKTGFLVRGKDKKIAVLESVPKKLSIEEIFLKKIFTPEGVEDICIKLLASDKINYEKLLEYCIKYKAVNTTGCYLDIINDIDNQLVPIEIINKFYQNISKNIQIFLKQEKKYGKAGWEKKYEKKWNVDLYLDLGSIKHGVRGL